MPVGVSTAIAWCIAVVSLTSIGMYIEILFRKELTISQLFVRSIPFIVLIIISSMMIIKDIDKAVIETENEKETKKELIRSCLGKSDPVECVFELE